jgi:hypothetical protein
LLRIIEPTFFLKPFNTAAPLPPVTITGNIVRRGPTLAIRYELRGELMALDIPAPTPQPIRRQGLWEETCCEFFLAPHDSAHYWEFNLSPAGHWNVYRLQDYRRGMAEEAAFTTLPFELQQRGNALFLGLELNMEKIIPADQALEVGISAVIKLIDGSRSYWALTHPGPQADFHRRDTFIVNL